MSHAFRFVAIEDFLDEPQPTIVFLVRPFVPVGSLILMHGQAGIGKSALSWQIANCVQMGTPFFGFPVMQGNVLYLDVDSPETGIRERLLKSPQRPQGWVLGHSFTWDVTSPIDHAKKSLRAFVAGREFALVFVNTLRLSHPHDDKESHVPGQVYGAFRELFPRSAIWFNHHDKKVGKPDEPRNDKEDFSGSQAWRNDAQVVLHLKPHPNKRPKVVLFEQTKNQMADDPPPLALKLSKDATHFELFKERWEEVAEAWLATAHITDQDHRIEAVEELTGCGRSQVYAHLKTAGIAYKVRGSV